MNERTCSHICSHAMTTLQKIETAWLKSDAHDPFRGKTEGFSFVSFRSTTMTTPRIEATL